MKIIFKILLTCFLFSLIPACATPKPKRLSEEEREKVEQRAMEQWENTQKQLQTDGYGKYDSDGEFIWKQKVKKKRFKVLNRKHLNKPKVPRVSR